MHDLYPSKEALDEDIGSGSTSWNDETFNQLDELLGSATWSNSLPIGQVNHPEAALCERPELAETATRSSTPTAAIRSGAA